MKKGILFIAIVLIGFTACAQEKFNFKIDGAAVTNWSGGVAGRQGAKYDVTLSWDAAPTGFTIDSVWSNGYGYAVKYKYKGGKVKERKKYVVHFAEDKSQVGLPKPGEQPGNAQQAKFKAKAPVNYTGAAVIRYITAAGKKHYITVNTYTKSSNVSYP